METVDYFYLIIDTSESMRGNKIGSVNDAINNMVFRLKRIKASKNITPKIIVLTFSDEVCWSTIFPVDVSSFSFVDPVVHGRASKLSNALMELDTKLMRQAEAPVSTNSNTTIVFFTDGLITDDWTGALETIRKNQTFQRARKIAVTFEDEVSVDIAVDNLRVLLGSEKNIIIDDFVEFNRIIFEQYK